MENIILGWYVLVETESVFLLTAYASLQYLGTLLAPFLGVVGDRVGQRRLLCVMRLFYTLTSSTLMVCAFTGILSPYVVLAVAAFSGLVRPSDIGVRNAVISEIMPLNQLLSASGIQRTTQDSARIAGALTGAGLTAALGMAQAYVAIACLYALSAWLTWQAGRAPAMKPPARMERESPWRELGEGLSYAWRTPHIKAVMCLALLLNATAFPLFNSLLPYVVKEVYNDTQTTLATLLACGSLGGLLGSILVSRFNDAISPARLMIMASCSWLVMLVIFSRMDGPMWGALALFFAGMSQACTLVPMTSILLRHTDARYRGRVMGIRMLMIYSNMPGILLFGPVVTALGYTPTVGLYCIGSLAGVVMITLAWRTQLWRADAPGNAR